MSTEDSNSLITGDSDKFTDVVNKSQDVSLNRSSFRKTRSSRSKNDGVDQHTELVCSQRKSRGKENTASSHQLDETVTVVRDFSELSRRVSRDSPVTEIYVKPVRRSKC